MGDIYYRALRSQDAVDMKQLWLDVIAYEPGVMLLTYEEQLKVPVRRLAQDVNGMLADPTALVLGAFSGRELIGVAAVEQQLTVRQSHRARLWGLCVNLEWRRRGIGQTLVRGLIEHCEGLGNVEQINLEVLGCAQAAIELFIAEGFHCFCHEPHAVRDGADYHDELRMLRVLCPPQKLATALAEPEVKEPLHGGKSPDTVLIDTVSDTTASDTTTPEVTDKQVAHDVVQPSGSQSEMPEAVRKSLLNVYSRPL
ncbi:MAG: GNAT family N-acetyltransferase [Marinobacterium sp.]|nr:GNAT family N-acetyltransferase [Marinobacterium sp.]